MFVFDLLPSNSPVILNLQPLFNRFGVQSSGLEDILSNKADESEQLGKGRVVTSATLLEAGESTQGTF